jgi:Icc-related predicted phosphoesterase
VYNWLLAVARKRRVEALVLAGDLLGFLDRFGAPEETQQHEGELLMKLLAAAEVPVLFIMGNDDLVQLTSTSERVQSIHGRGVSMGSFNFVGYQYSLPFMGGIFEKPEARIKADLIHLAPLLDAQTIFVSHSPAYGILDPGFCDTRIGSISIREFLESRPFRAHIHGHSHAGFGRDGKHFNVASAAEPRAMILDLGTMEHEVLGREHVSPEAGDVF